MSELENVRIALLSGGVNDWRESIIPALLTQTKCLTVVETIEELLALQASEKPEVLFICHQPAIFDGLGAAEQFGSLYPITPLVLLAMEDFQTMKTALAIGVDGILEPPFAEGSLSAICRRCNAVVRATRWEALKQQHNQNVSKLFMQSPFCQLFVNSEGIVTDLNHEASRLFGVGADTKLEFSELSRRFFAPHALTYPLEMEMAVQHRTTWNGILNGRLADGTVRMYQTICVPLTLTDGVLVNLHDCTSEQTGQAQLYLSLQAARDCLLFAPSETSRELLQLSYPPNEAALTSEIFSLRTLLKSVSAEVENVIPPYLPENFRGDSTKLSYALKAILRGCLFFSNGATTVVLSVKNHTPEKITVQISIRTEILSEKNDSYQKVRDYLVANAENPGSTSGLGLAATLLERMGGTLFIRSERGLCRTVCCSLPLIPEADVSPAGFTPVVPTPTLVNSPLKILVAEDNPLEQTALKHLLEGIGYQVIIVGNGKEAVDEFEHGEFDVVLMDILMPEMDGFEATRLIREKERITGGITPVVALTSYSLKAIQEKCAGVGMNGYLSKPVAKNKLIEALQQINKPQKPANKTEVFMNVQDVSEKPVLDARTVLEELGVETFHELVDMYLTGYADTGHQLVVKLAGNDLTDIKECAHSLKGIVANIGGLRLMETANRIQEMCREGDKPDHTVWAPLVSEQTEALKEALEQLDWKEMELLATENS